MKKTLAYGAATAVMALALGTGTGFLSSCSREDVIVTLYGTPVVELDPSTPTGKPTPIAPTPCLYGPPVIFGQDKNDVPEDQTGESDDQPEAPTPQAPLPTLYGPPTL